MNLLKQRIRQSLGLQAPTAPQTPISAAAPIDESRIPASDWEVIRKQTKALETAFSTDHKAKYVIELMFQGQLRRNTPVMGLMSVWRRPKSEEGGLMRGLYFCPGRLKGVNNCYAIIPEFANNGGQLVCPTCGKIWRSEEGLGQTSGRMTAQRWARTLAVHISERLERSVDLVVKIHVRDLRTDTAIELAGKKAGELIAKTDEQMVTYRYEYENLMRDLGNGSSLEAKLYAFFRHFGA